MGPALKYNGVEYKSLAEIAVTANIAYNSLRRRTKNGMSIDEAVKILVDYRNKKYTYRGKDYKSINKLAEELKINSKALSIRVSKGNTIEDAVSQLIKYTPRARKIEYRGKMYNSTRELTDELGLSYYSFSLFILNRDTLTNAVEDYLEYINKEKLTVWGKEFSSISKLALYYGVNKKSLHHRIKKLYMQAENAVIDCLELGVEFKGIRYVSMAALSITHNILPTNVINRLAAGWDLDRALTSPIGFGTGTSIVYKGIEYTSKVSLCRKFGFDSSFVSNISRTNKIDWILSFSILDSFFSTCGGDKPNIISRIPYNIYNGTWTNSCAEFVNICGVGLIPFTNNLDKVSDLSSFDVMKKIKATKEIQYLYNEKYYKHKDLISTAKQNAATLTNNGKAVKEQVLKYQNCTFEMVGYCKDTLNEFRKYRDYRLSLI